MPFATTLFGRSAPVLSPDTIVVTTANGSPISSTTPLTQLTHLQNVRSNVQIQIDQKQDILVSAGNIKTVDGNNVVGTGNLTLAGVNAVPRGCFISVVGDAGLTGLDTDWLECKGYYQRSTAAGDGIQHYTPSVDKTVLDFPDDVLKTLMPTSGKVVPGYTSSGAGGVPNLTLTGIKSPYVVFFNDTHGICHQGGGFTGSNHICPIWETFDGGVTWALTGKNFDSGYKDPALAAYTWNIAQSWIIGNRLVYLYYGYQSVLRYTDDFGVTWQSSDWNAFSASGDTLFNRIESVTVNGVPQVIALVKYHGSQTNWRVVKSLNGIDFDVAAEIDSFFPIGGIMPAPLANHTDFPYDGGFVENVMYLGAGGDVYVLALTLNANGNRPVSTSEYLAFCYSYDLVTWYTGDYTRAAYNGTYEVEQCLGVHKYHYDGVRHYFVTYNEDDVSTVPFGGAAWSSRDGRFWERASIGSTSNGIIQSACVNRSLIGAVGRQQFCASIGNGAANSHITALSTGNLRLPNFTNNTTVKTRVFPHSGQTAGGFIYMQKPTAADDWSLWTLVYEEDLTIISVNSTFNPLTTGVLGSTPLSLPVIDPSNDNICLPDTRRWFLKIS